MKKIFAFLFSLLALCGTEAVAQTPTEMQYQLLVLNPETGQVRASQEVQVRIELRQGSETGQAVWAHEQTATTDARGLCNLTLDFGSSVDWTSGDYYLASVIDGKECGAPKLTAVPYALCANALADVMTTQELIGRWQRTGNDAQGYFVFNADGTMVENYGGDDDVISWFVTRTGKLVTEEDVEGYEGELEHRINVYDIIKISTDEFILQSSDSGYRFRRQR